MEELKKKYESIVAEYVDLFCDKQGLEFLGWVAGDIGTVGCFGDLYFNFEDIRLDLHSNFPRRSIIEWNDEVTDTPILEQLKGTIINYSTWAKIKKL